MIIRIISEMIIIINSIRIVVVIVSLERRVRGRERGIVENSYEYVGG